MIGRVARLYSAAAAEARFRWNDRAARLREKEAAAHDHPLDGLDAELEAAQAALAVVLEERFDRPMEANRRQLRTILVRGAELERQLGVLTRNLNAELSAAFAELERLNTLLAEARQELADAYEELESAKEDLDRWHAKADSSLPFYGWRGKEIPRHRFFGFSYADRVSAEARRDRARDAIGSAKDDRDEIKAQRDEARARIGAIKRDRQERHSMLQRGRCPQVVRQELEPLRRERARLEGAEGRLSRARATCEREGPEAQAIAALRSRIDAVQAARAARLAAFDGPAARDERRRIFLAAQAQA